MALLDQASHQPLQVQETLTQIITFREQLYTIFWSIASGRVLEKQELDVVQQIYLEALSHAELTKSGEQYVWQWRVEKECLISPLWPIIQSAVDLLTTSDATRIKVCPGAPRQTVACGWLFYDESKNRTRHWCNMADCGKRAKARRLTEHRRAVRQKQRAF